MATPHPGKWELLLNASACELGTVDSAVHAAVVANRNTGVWKVLYFTGTQSFLWNPQNPAQVSGPQPIPPWPDPTPGPPNLFCSGHSHMEDGRLLVAGGTRPEDPTCPGPGSWRGLPYAYLFNPLTEQWSIGGTVQNPHAMADGRWYPTLTTLGAGQGYGEVVAMSGLRKDVAYVGTDCYAQVNKDPEIYNPATGWRMMADPPQAVQPFDELYTGAHVVPYGSRAGKVFYSSPMTQAWAFDPFASEPPVNGGYWTAVGGARATHRGDGNSVLLPLLPGATSARVLILGGGDPATKTAEIMNVAAASPSWVAAAPMFFARRNANAVILPDDRVLMVGGNLSGGSGEPVYTAEAYDVAANAWTLLPAMNRERVYHSTAVLLPDGRVWAAGSLAEITHENVELYSPGYLFEGERPAITSAPSVIHYGTTFAIKYVAADLGDPADPAGRGDARAGHGPAIRRAGVQPDGQVGSGDGAGQRERGAAGDVHAVRAAGEGGQPVGADGDPVGGEDRPGQTGTLEGGAPCVRRRTCWWLRPSRWLSGHR